MSAGREDLIGTINELRRERDELRAQVERVRAMAVEWQRLANSETDPDEAEAASVAAESLLRALGGQP